MHIYNPKNCGLHSTNNFVNCSNPRLYRDTLTTVHAHSSTLTYCITYIYTWHQIRILDVRTHTIGDADTSPGVLDLHNTDNTIRIRHTAQAEKMLPRKYWADTVSFAWWSRICPITNSLIYTKFKTGTLFHRIFFLLFKTANRPFSFHSIRI